MGLLLSPQLPVLLLLLFASAALSPSNAETFDVRKHLSTVTGYDFAKENSKNAFMESTIPDECTVVHVNLVGCGNSYFCPYEVFKQKIFDPHMKQDYDSLCQKNLESPESCARKLLKREFDSLCQKKYESTESCASKLLKDRKSNAREYKT